MSLYREEEAPTDRVSEQRSLQVVERVLKSRIETTVAAIIWWFFVLVLDDMLNDAIETSCPFQETSVHPTLELLDRIWQNSRLLVLCMALTIARLVHKQEFSQCSTTRVPDFKNDTLVPKCPEVSVLIACLLGTRVKTTDKSMDMSVRDCSTKCRFDM
ncbi:hypothetical protein PHYSODRAFT_301568 [Phytophthora sojae]|uniref:Uncharacterized protein n=1 Tax=Phytophthora sojae (strain P6497) TaxID=1094619 RepID=G4ZMA1_PHYSP|nr:hypothetical protein PHYSODRAFT_301566 [Phytophthora sojae]XP_009528383.1 hypothetical protein PHYSODRAFT_301568 [Phytophthora sojae]EGZ14632.1 hypothetical protein PHYSODRAFT_301566 [Phytophthora sojae]EGZ14634.1 hypothetical protein PHYSODRAFT_301568 [Phytophthora sojae]|eukprot:XP_009528381.1 hypothetical protein PHYSODRAFT_301566 [Phytophthora sojae]